MSAHPHMDTYYEPAADWSLIPQHMHDGIKRWVMLGEEQGGFLMALLRNDFMDAAGRADMDNLASLAGWAKFLYAYTPSSCWGSPDNVAVWEAKGGLLGPQS